MAFKKEISFAAKLSDMAQAMLGSPSFKLFLVGIGILIFLVAGVLIIRKMNRLKRVFVIANEASKLEKFVESANFRTKTYEKEFRENLNLLSTSGSEALSITQRILRTLENRLNEIETLLKRGSEDDIKEAKRLLSSNLQDDKNSMNNVISADPVPELAPEEWMPAINKLIDSMDKELTRVEKLSGELTDSVVRKAQGRTQTIKNTDEEKKYRRRLTFRSLVKHLDN